MLQKQSIILALSIVLADVLVLGGCRPKQVDFSAEQRESTATVTIQEDIAFPDTAYYSGPAEGWARVFGGVIGALIAEQEAENDDILAHLVESREIDLKAIVHEEIHKHFVASNPVGRVVTENGDADFQFAVTHYGMTLAAFSFSVTPTLGIHGKLVRPDGTVIWERREAAGGMTGDLPVKSFDEWMADLDATRAVYRGAVQVAVAALAESMKAAKH